MATYTKYLTTSNVIYNTVIEPSSKNSTSEYMYCGNDPDGTAHYVLLKLPSDFPDAGLVSSATIRLVETDDGYTNTLEMKVSPISTAWTTSTTWANKPTIVSGTVDQFDLTTSNDPASDNYDGRRTRYKYYAYSLITHSYMGTVYSSTYKGESYNALYDGEPCVFNYQNAVYDNYWVRHTIDITDTIQSCITNGYDSIALWFNTGGNSTKRFFRSPNNSSTYQPLLTVNYTPNPNPTPPTIPTIPTVTTSPKTFSWNPGTDTSGIFTQSQLLYEWQISFDNGSSWGATYTSDAGQAYDSLDVKSVLSIQAGQYYYNTQCKIRVLTRTPTYNGTIYRSSLTTSAAFTIDYRIAPSAPTLSVSNSAPYEGETVTFTATRPTSYNTHDSDGNVMDLDYRVYHRYGTYLTNETNAVSVNPAELSYIVGNLTTGMSDITGYYAYCFCKDAELQQGPNSNSPTFNIKRFRAPIINIGEIVRDETTAVVHIVIQDTGYGGTQTADQINKVQFSLAGAAYADVTLDGAWDGLTNSFTVGTGVNGAALAAGTSYSLGVKAINNAPDGTALSDKTSGVASATILAYTPGVFLDENGFMALSGYIGDDYETTVDPGDFIVGGVRLNDDGWTAVSTFLNSWANFDPNYSSVAYKKIGNQVLLKGVAKSGTLPGNIFTLPKGYRPAKNQLYAVASNNAYGQAYVYSDGNVRASHGSNTWFSLDGISFCID